MSGVQKIALLLKESIVIEAFLINSSDPIINSLQEDFIIVDSDNFSIDHGVGQRFDLNTMTTLIEKPYPSWVWDHDSSNWEPPICYYGAEESVWNEFLMQWEIVKKIPKDLIPKVEEF